MPITVPTIDGRSYQELVDEAIARIPVHNPEWTNFNRSDPGVTLVELFAFMTENLLYRANRIPERNRRAFLSLLGIGLRPADAARGLVTIANERGPLRTVTVNDELEVRAGELPFRTELGLDVLPVEGRAYFKRPVPLTDEMRQLYDRLYASFLLPDGDAAPPAELSPYVTTHLDGTDPAGLDLVTGTADGSLWLALFARPGEATDLPAVRDALAGKTLSLGVVPVNDAPEGLTAPPTGTGGTEDVAHLEFALPVVPADGRLPADPRARVATYAVRDAVATVNVLRDPGVVQVSLPSAEGLRMWTDLEPVEAGADDFPPAIEDPRLAERLVTWLRIRTRSANRARLLRVDLNATPVRQRARIAGEVLPDGTGAPDQAVRLARIPVLPGSVVLTVTEPGGTPPVTKVWEPIDDLVAAGPEVPVADPRLPPGAPQPPPGPVDVYALDPEAGVLRFGDGTHGRRPPPGATLRADYDQSAGRAGNVGAGAVTTGPALPPGFTVTNPVRTWGGADAESVDEGEKQVARYLRHRDRLVSATDFATIARRTPGVEIGRVEVLPAFDPQLRPDLPGAAPGAVTLMLVPRYDQTQPDAPRPDRFFLDAVCAHLEPRRLVTTELFLRGPDYVPLWVSVGIDVEPGRGIAEVREAVAAQLSRVLSPLPLDQQVGVSVPDSTYTHADTGWPLRTAVTTVELAAVATRVAGVRVVTGVLLAAGNGGVVERVELAGLQLPRVAGLSVVPGEPVGVDALRGGPTGPPTAGPRRIPVPVVPEGC